MVEFALVLPVLLVIVLGTVDLGRAFFMTVNVANAVKEGAFFGARSPSCDTSATSGCGDPQNVHWRVEQELDKVALDTFEAKCFDPGTTDFSGAGKALTDCHDGDLYYVHVSTPFNLITPLIATLVGNTITLSGSATSVVLTDFGTGDGPVVIPTASAAPTLAPGTCTVPDFRNGTKLNQAQSIWTTVGGFTTSVTAIGPSGQGITYQSLPAGYVGSCTTTTITVSNSPQVTPSPSPSPAPTPTPTPGGGPTPTPTPTPTPAGACVVPQLVRSPKLSVTQAQAIWTGAGFTAANFSAVRPPNNDYDVGTQSLAAALSMPCLTTSITVDK